MKIIEKSSDLLSLATAHYHNLSDKIPFAYGLTRHKAGTGYRYDMHYGLEFGMVLNGEMSLIFPGLKIKLSAGDVWFCGMWEPHGWSAGRTSYDEVNLVVWPPALACLRFDETDQFNWLAPFVAPPRWRPQTNEKNRPAMLELGVKIKDCLKKQENRMWLWIRLFVMEAILLATDRWSGAKLSTAASVGSAARLNQVLQRFFDKRGLMSNEEAAGICGLNRNAFSLMFRRLMGLPFADFALRYRLDAAASGLRQTGESVKSIALFWGFADTSHFDRLFARHYGCTPYEYRQKKMQNEKMRNEGNYTAGGYSL
ncbi:MAG: AraC family transcriptional regulator [Verrucomicrobia bacterium]|nr:AraC family transcriptional regulator [Verrucomicrobiota bacterium]MBU1735091.1 AraC family transcriptional regulator [Verrucomicrobiota bacterium]MBU1856393.1 AraC family transcriptional regulator [Verrucomicrobiota bacterium]